jgi:rod shape-determining protein MreD
MNNTLFFNVFRFFILLTLQIAIFNNINLLGFISPFPYILFIILYPVSGNKSGLLITSFFLGIILDMFSNSGGIHTSACIILAYYRPGIFKFAFGVSYEYQTIKLNNSLTPERFTFLSVSVLLHHGILFVLEAFQFSLIWDIFVRIILSSIITIIICIILIYLFKPNKR